MCLAVASKQPSIFTRLEDIRYSLHMINKKKEGDLTMLAEKHYNSEEEFIKLREQEGVIVEMIGDIIYMSPAPAVKHQRLLSELYIKLNSYFKGTKCESLLGINLRLYDNKGIKICDVIPDLSVFCNLDNEDYEKVFLEKIPKIIVEIISPSSVYLDNIKKTILYKQVGVIEYWLVDIKNKTLTIWDFINDEQCICKGDDLVSSQLFKDLSFNLNELFNQ